MGTIGQNPGTLSFLPKYHEISWLHGFLTTPDHSTCCCQIPYSLVSSHVHTFSPAFALQEAEVPRFITFYHMPGLSPWSLIRNSLQDLDHSEKRPIKRTLEFFDWRGIGHNHASALPPSEPSRIRSLTCVGRMPNQTRTLRLNFHQNADACKENVMMFFLKGKTYLDG